MHPDDISVHEIDLQKVLPLRTEILRPHFPDRLLANFDDDDDEQTRHFAAILNSTPVGVLSIYSHPFPAPEALPDSLAPDENALHLRGMAVDAHLQGHGIGSLLLSTVLTRLPLSYPFSRLIWCNARQRAVSFYQRHGFVPIGESFPVEAIGPHLRMARRLPQALA